MVEPVDTLTGTGTNPVKLVPGDSQPVVPSIGSFFPVLGFSVNAGWEEGEIFLPLLYLFSISETLTTK